MRSNEFLPLTEAVSFSKYHNVLENSVKIGIMESLKDLASKMEPIVDSVGDQVTDSAYPMLQKIISDKLYKKALGSRIKIELFRYIKNNVLSDIVDIVFKDLRNNVGGQTNGLTIEIADDILDPIVNNVLNRIYDYTLDNVESQEQGNHLYQYTYEVVTRLSKTIKSSADKVREYNFLFDSLNDDDINAIVDVVTHELVHVQQHSKQESIFRYEYRSYLDRNKNEFKNLAAKRYMATVDPNNPDLTDEELARYYQLYISSPQEIKAFSSEMANRVFRNIASHLDTAEDLENLKQDRDNIKSDVVYVVKQFINSYHRDLTSRLDDPTFVKIYRRYLSSVVNQVMDSIDHKISSISVRRI